MSTRHRVLIVGGGFGGLACAREFSRSHQVEVMLVDRRNYHLFQPLLYQVATGELSPANIASPLRAIVRRQQNCTVLMGEVTDIDPQRKVVSVQGNEMPYDTLVLATGAGHSYFGNDQWAQFAPGLKTIEDATEIRKRILFAFEAAEREEDEEARRCWLTFAIVGAGPTGVELAGALSEIAHVMMKRDFRRINPGEAKILLIEAMDKPLGMYPPELCEKARKELEKLKITVRTQCRVTNIDAERVTVESETGPEIISTRTVIWAAGVAASPLGRLLAKAAGAETDRAGRVIVQPDLSLATHPEIFVVGDLAHVKNEQGKQLPALAPVAMQQGKYVAHRILNQLAGVNSDHKAAFHYHDRGSMAVIGRYSAIALVGKRQLSGFLAWSAWLFIHLMEITQFRNRFLVLFQWGWTYFTRDRAARLITGFIPPPECQAKKRKPEISKSA